MLAPVADGRRNVVNYFHFRWDDSPFHEVWWYGKVGIGRGCLMKVQNHCIYKNAFVHQDGVNNWLSFLKFNYWRIP